MCQIFTRFPVCTAGSGGDVGRVGGSSDEHPERPCSRNVDEKVVPEPQTSRRIRQRLPGEAQILTGELRLSHVMDLNSKTAACLCLSQLYSGGVLFVPQGGSRTLQLSDRKGNLTTEESGEKTGLRIRC